MAYFGVAKLCFPLTVKANNIKGNQSLEWSWYLNSSFLISSLCCHTTFKTCLKSYFIECCFLLCHFQCLTVYSLEKFFTYLKALGSLVVVSCVFFFILLQNIINNLQLYPNPNLHSNYIPTS